MYFFLKRYLNPFIKKKNGAGGGGGCVKHCSRGAKK